MGFLRRVVVSPDSKHVVLLTGRNRIQPRGYPPVSKGTYFFDVGNLAKPAFVADTEADSNALAIDPATGQIYTNGGAYSLLILSAEGRRQREFLQGRWAHRLAVHPSGRQILMLGTDQTAWADFTNWKPQTDPQEEAQ